MTLEEFQLWFEGFKEGVDCDGRSTITVKQWETVKSKINQIREPLTVPYDNSIPSKGFGKYFYNTNTTSAIPVRAPINVYQGMGDHGIRITPDSSGSLKAEAVCGDSTITTFEDIQKDTAISRAIERASKLNW